jgi:hypothetical protein
LLGENIGVVFFDRFENAMTLGDFCEDGAGQRICLMKGEEVEPAFFFPMREAAAVANVDFAVIGLDGALGACVAICLRCVCDWIRGEVGADGDVRATAGREAGGTCGLIR